MKNILLCRSVGLDSTKIVALLSESYEIKTASALSEACTLIGEFSPEIIICGETFSGLPIGDISEKLKSGGAKLLVILSEERSEPYDIVQNGANDVIFPPFTLPELITRIGTLCIGTKKSTQQIFRNAEMTVDYKNCRIYIADKPLHLTMLEYKLLCLLSKNCGTVVDYNTILRELWQTPIGNEILSLRVFVNAIRRKIKNLGGNINYL